MTQALWQAVMGDNPSYFVGDDRPVERVCYHDCMDFIKKWGGALNCCTWTVSEDMSKLHHNTENDNKYKSIIEKYQNDSNSVCFDEIQFLGDYYPRKIENVSKELNRLYYGF